MTPEGCGHHLGHVATEAVDAFRCPKLQDGCHLMPSVWGRGIVGAASAGVAVVDTVVELHGLVPVGGAWAIIEMVVASSAGGLLAVGADVECGLEGLAPTVVEIVLGREVLGGIVVLSEVVHVGRLGGGMVLSGDVVGHEVDDDLQSGFVGAVEQCLKLVHATGHVDGKVGVDVVVVDDGIGRSGFPLDDGGVLRGQTVGGVVGRGGMAYYAGVPDVGEAHLPDTSEHTAVEVVELATAILDNGPVGGVFYGTIAEQTWQDLIEEQLLTRFHER